jgi:hypothetical protein
MKALLIFMMTVTISTVLFLSVYHTVTTFGWLHLIVVINIILWFSIMGYLIHKLD